MSSYDVDDSKVIDDAHVPLKILSITEDISVSSGTLIFDKAHVSSDSISDDVDEIVEPKTPALPNKSFKFACA